MASSYASSSAEASAPSKTASRKGEVCDTEVPASLMPMRGDDLDDGDIAFPDSASTVASCMDGYETSGCDSIEKRLAAGTRLRRAATDRRTARAASCRRIRATGRLPEHAGKRRVR